jgi:hypothetical protein
MSDNAFDMVRKIRHLPGLKLTATIDPQYITKRVKNAAQKMLRTGILSAGYRSQSRMLAEQLLDDAGVAPAASANSWAVRIYANEQLTKEARARLIEIANASRMVELASLSAGRDAKYLNERYETLMSGLRQRKAGAFSFHLHNTSLTAQAAEVVASCRTPEQVTAHEALAAKLDSLDPFAINFYA